MAAKIEVSCPACTTAFKVALPTPEEALDRLSRELGNQGFEIRWEGGGTVKPTDRILLREAIEAFLDELRR